MDDLISRQAAIDAMTDKNIICNMDSVQDSELHRIKRAVHRILASLPSVQPEPCEDAVSRDSVKFLLCKETCHPGAFCPDGFCMEICEKVDALPSATPKQRMGEWIPVSERLPESKYEDLEYPTVIVCCGDGAVTLACYYESTKEWGTGEYYDRIINPVAWMPLPEPYRAERRTDD